MESEKVDLRRIGVWTLTQIIEEAGDEVTSHLIDALDDNDAKIRLTAARGLIRINRIDEAVRGFMGLLANDDPAIRSSAIWDLKSLKERAATALSDLTEALHDDDPDVRLAAARAVWEIGKRDDLAVPSMIEAMNDDDAWIRSRAIDALVDIGDPAAVAVPALINALHDEDPDIRSSAAFALGEFGAKAKAAVPILLGALQLDEKGGDGAIRRVGISALNKIDPELFAKLRGYIDK